MGRTDWGLARLRLAAVAAGRPSDPHAVHDAWRAYSESKGLRWAEPADHSDPELVAVYRADRAPGAAVSSAPGPDGLDFDPGDFAVS
jgi:hypothetical protein